MTDVLVLDYGAGNLRSVVRAIQRVGGSPRISDRGQDLHDARVVVMPGVGAAADTMRNLTEHGLVEPVREYIASGRPFLGVCMGLQALLTVSEEGGRHACLDVIPGSVRRLPDGQKVPHMGWNTVHQTAAHPIFAGIPDDSYFYFVHSYHVEPDDPSCVIAETDYGRTFPAVVARDNVVATQFHPEKSGEHGLRIYANFLATADLSPGPSPRRGGEPHRHGTTSSAGEGSLVRADPAGFGVPTVGPMPGSPIAHQ